MTGVVVSAVMESVLVKLNELVGDTFTNLIGMSKDIQFLRDELPAMSALLKKLEDNEQLDPQVKNWRNQVLDMTYDIEDCIDDFKSNVRSVDAKASLISKVSNFVMTLRVRFDTAQQIKELKTCLQDINDRRKRYKVDDYYTSSTTIEALDARLPALFNEADRLVGVENPKVELIKWVLDEDQKMKVVSVVGRGGLGKTTLANEVYREVGERFNCKAFVSVSRTPDMIRILTNMLLQLGKNQTSSASDHQHLVNELRKYLDDKRYLIIVDDLWDVPPWDTIRCAFPANNQQSRVIITTRHVDVARACCTDRRYIHYMQPLSDTNSRTLFFKRISVSGDDSHFQSSEAVLCEILKKCGGLPLAIITISSILACQQSGRLKEQWECIKNSLANQSATNPTLDQMVHILDLSYKSLPHNLKSCFLYLGKYPEDYEIRRDDLVRQWVAEDIVTSSRGRDVWDIAEGCFNGLVNRSMIQPIYDAYSTEVLQCRVHDMMLDLILRRCEEDNFLIAVRDPQEAAEARYKVRRLSIDMSGTKDVTMSVTTTSLLSQVRSLNIFGGNCGLPKLSEFMFMRLLFLEVDNLKTAIDLTGINHLSQLRYLRVQGSSTEAMLPAQIRGLRFLETLDLSGLLNFCGLPELVDVPRLSHVSVPMFEGWRLPDGIGKVKSLVTLTDFSLAMSSSRSITGLGELSALTELKLNVETGRNKGVVPWPTLITALITSLEKLGNLKILMLWSPLAVYCGDAILRSSFSPPFRNIEELYLGMLIFSSVPRWISHLCCLRRLTLVAKQIHQEDFNIIGTKLTSLVLLSLQIVHVPTERIVIEGSIGFKVLKLFDLDCDGLSRLIFEAGAMPDLRELNLALHPHEWDKTTPIGLQHLPSLRIIHVSKAKLYSDKRIFKDEDTEMIRVVFQEAVDALPAGPALHVSTGGGWRLRREEMT